MSVPVEKAKFAARELLARFEKGLGHPFPHIVREHMLSAFELGYLRGFGDGMEHSYGETCKALDALKAAQ